jgi:hypothetical protein
MYVVEMCYKMKHMSENSSSVNIMKLIHICLPASFYSYHKIKTLSNYLAYL